MHLLEISLIDPCRFTPPASDAPHLLGAPDVGVYTVVPIIRDTQCSTNRITLVLSVIPSANRVSVASAWLTNLRGPFLIMHSILTWVGELVAGEFLTRTTTLPHDYCSTTQITYVGQSGISRPRTPTNGGTLVRVRFYSHLMRTRLAAQSKIRSFLITNKQASAQRGPTHCV